MTSLDNEMINDEYNKNEQLILNLTYEAETGRLILSDNYNNHYLCDLFGRIKTKFLPNITGQASYIERKNFNSARNFQPKNKKENLKTEENTLIVILIYLICYIYLICLYSIYKLFKKENMVVIGH